MQNTPKIDQEIYLSVVVPAYLQETTIKRNLKDIASYLKGRGYLFEVICVVDGSPDTTLEKAKAVNDPNVRVFGYEHNKGKGYALRYGMARSRGKVIAFLDAGFEIPPASIVMGLQHFEWYNADIIVGSKRHIASKVHYPFIRRILSFGYQFLARALFSLKIRDTQVGVKIFRREVLEKTLPRLLVKRYAFDIEILAVANYLGFNRIYESPVEIKYNFQSLTKASTLRTILNMAKDTLAVFYRLRILNYYDSKMKRKWVYDPELDQKVNVG